jgi:hypothetical protein
MGTQHIHIMVRNFDDEYDCIDPDCAGAYWEPGRELPGPCVLRGPEESRELRVLPGEKICYPEVHADWELTERQWTFETQAEPGAIPDVVKRETTRDIVFRPTNIRIGLTERRDGPVLDLRASVRLYGPRVRKDGSLGQIEHTSFWGYSAAAMPGWLTGLVDELLVRVSAERPANGMNEDPDIPRFGAGEPDLG